MKFIRFLFSGTLMGILLIVFAVVIGYATFIENDFDATTAKMLVYNARWFEALMGLMIINFAGMIFTRQLYRKSKWNILAIHVALIIILIGAAITRYFGFEGQMHIREGQTTNRYLSADTYVNIHLDDGTSPSSMSKRIWLSPVRRELISQKIEYRGQQFNVSIGGYIPNAVEGLQPHPNGKPVVSLATAGMRGREDAFLSLGETVMLNNTIISFGDTSNDHAVQFIMQQGQLFVKVPAHAHDDGTMHESSFEPVVPMEVYHTTTMNFLIKDYSDNAIISFVPPEDAQQPGIGVARAEVNGRQMFLRWNEWNQLTIDGITVSCKFGNQTWELPFSLKLNEFQLERYPGSMSPSSFASEITLIDERKNLEKPYRIFMNNILEHGGYRFYQSSYDNDEKGTILSVNHDYWGTLVTYIGYFLLFATLLLSLFLKKNRFRRVSDKIREIHDERRKMAISVTLVVLFLSVTTGVMASSEPAPSKDHAAGFGQILIQNKDGRIIPVNTIASQVLVKMYKKARFQNLTADQVFLGMMVNQNYWQQQPMIKVSDPGLLKILGISGPFARYIDFFDTQGSYKLKSMVEEAYAKKPALRNMLDKELIYVDERVNVAYLTYNGSFLRFYPLPKHADNLWISPADHQHTTDSHEVLSGQEMLFEYFEKLNTAMLTGDYEDADLALAAIKLYQQKEGSAIIPPAHLVRLEIFYNNASIFKRLFPFFMTLGVILFGLMFVQVFNPDLKFKWIIWTVVGLLAIGFLMQTAGLVMRWMIAGRAPWSNGYESMIYISWATMLAGFIFMKRTPIILSVTALLTGVTLLTAHMNWLNPEITNLVPVLKSYWLTIHVATITASYGFFGLASLTGFLNLCIMIFRNKSNLGRVNLTLKELTLVIELALSIGLILLIMGNFLGGIWANESWGRYWGWDPKETWSLVTIIVYAFILHMRLIPGLRSTFTFNFLAMFAISSVLMTYFGVNYYLSGLHSYASGDPVPVPTFVYWVVGIMLLISALAAYNDYMIKDQSPVLEEAED